LLPSFDDLPDLNDVLVVALWEVTLSLALLFTSDLKLNLEYTISHFGHFHFGVTASSSDVLICPQFGHVILISNPFLVRYNPARCGVLTPPERGSFVVGCFMAVFFATKQATEKLLAVTGFVRQTTLNPT
jgi:hypothetical protein